MRRRADLGAFGAVAAVAAVTVIVVRRQPDWSLAGAVPARLPVEVLAALALAMAGIVLRRRGSESRSGTLLIAAAAAWLMAEWNNPGAPGALLFTAGLVLTEASAPLIAHALLVHGRGRPRDRAQLVVAIAAYTGLLVAGGVGATLATDPATQGCVCPPNLLRIADAPGLAAGLQRWGLGLGTAALLVTVVLLARALWRASTARRRSAAPVVIAGLVYLAVAVVRHVHAWPAWPGNDATEQALRLAESLALLAIASGVAWQGFAARRMRHRVTRIVMQLAHAPRPGELRRLLADALGDPTLELLHTTDEGWIDATGAARSLPDGDGRAVTALTQADAVVAVVVHRPGLLDDPRLVGELAHAAALALRHDRLQAQLRAQLERLRQSRITAVMAADSERRELERDLHDGAQQALAALAIAVEIERASAMGASATALGRAHADVRGALEAVRTIAHGLYPAVLSDAGLAPALDVLTEWSPNLECEPVTEGRFDPALESTAYFIVAALARATTSPVTASLVHHDGRLFVDVATVDAPDVGELEDRVGAVGGRLRVRLGSRSEHLLRAELPCA